MGVDRSHHGAETAAAERLQSKPSGPLNGRVRAPGDKSISHRSMILGGLASGVTDIEGLLEGDDVLATARAVKAFGATVDQLGQGRWRIEGRGGYAQPAEVIDCGNSGTGVRLLMGAASGFDLATRFDGDASLRKRPMGRVIEPLTAMGARFDASEGGRLPLTVHGGKIHAIDYRLPMASAQVKSAILLAGLGANGVTTVVEPEPTRDHTERMLRAFGVGVDVEDTPEGRRIRLTPGPLKATPVHVPGDPSSAAFPIVAGLLVPGSEVTVEGVLLNPLRTGLLDTLSEMGAEITIARRDGAGESVGDVTVRASKLRGVTVPPVRAPSMIDEYPILAAAAAFAEGPTVMRGIGELRVKESDRIALMVAGLRACGVEVDEEPDGLVVHGRGRPPRGGAEVHTAGDHRIAMAHLVLGLAAEQPVTVDEPGMIATSFPGFVALMRSLGGQIGAV
jgi:3-phosphoshikimate 1-carboxyvinyltransferase